MDSMQACIGSSSPALESAGRQQPTALQGCREGWLQGLGAQAKPVLAPWVQVTLLLLLVLLLYWVQVTLVLAPAWTQGQAVKELCQAQWRWARWLQLHEHSLFRHLLETGNKLRASAQATSFAKADLLSQGHSQGACCPEGGSQATAASSAACCQSGRTEGQLACLGLLLLVLGLDLAHALAPLLDQGVLVRGLCLQLLSYACLILLLCRLHTQLPQNLPPEQNA